MHLSPVSCMCVQDKFVPLNTFCPVSCPVCPGLISTSGPRWQEAGGALSRQRSSVWLLALSTGLGNRAGAGLDGERCLETDAPAPSVTSQMHPKFADGAVFLGSSKRAGFSRRKHICEKCCATQKASLPFYFVRWEITGPESLLSSTLLFFCASKRRGTCFPLAAELGRGTYTSP